MSPRTKPPFRADHVGSLLRPAELRRAREYHQTGRITAAQLQAAEDEAIRKAVRLQEDVGLQGISDGEMRRTSWHMDFFYQIPGVKKSGERINVPFRGQGAGVAFTADAIALSGKVMLDRTIFGDAFNFLKSVTTRTPKLTIPSPSVLHGTMTRVAGPAAYSHIYPQQEELLHDVAQVYRDELARLAQLGCTYLQLDDTTFATICDPAGRAAYAKGSDDADRRHLPISTWSTTRSKSVRLAWLFACTPAVAIIVPPGLLPEPMTSLLNRCSANWMWTAFSWNTMTLAQVASSRCASYRKVRWQCWA